MPDVVYGISVPLHAKAVLALKIIRNKCRCIQYSLDCPHGTILCLLFLCLLYLTLLIHMPLPWNVWSCWGWTLTDGAQVWALDWLCLSWGYERWLLNMGPPTNTLIVIESIFSNAWKQMQRSIAKHSAELLEPSGRDKGAIRWTKRSRLWWQYPQKHLTWANGNSLTLDWQTENLHMIRLGCGW